MNARLTELEIKLSFSEDLLDALNLTVYRQQQEIEQLRAEFRALREQVLEGSAGAPASLDQELPPHY
jgi:SlyX protein